MMTAYLPFVFLTQQVDTAIAYLRGLCVARPQKMGHARASDSGTSNGSVPTLFYHRLNWGIGQILIISQ